MQAYSDTFIPILPVDIPLHTPEWPFCSDTPCSCHEDATLLAEVAQAAINGLFTSDEATGFVADRMV